MYLIKTTIHGKDNGYTIDKDGNVKQYTREEAESICKRMNEKTKAFDWHYEPVECET